MSVEATLKHTATRIRGAGAVLTRFSFKSALRGAMLYGVSAGGMIALQGLAFAASYKGAVARAQFATTLASNPTLGILYGEARQLETAAGYMVYRSMPFMAFIGALWGLFVSTRLLRGQEEDGRFELLLTGKKSLVRGTQSIIFGLLLNWLGAFVVCAIILTLLARSPEINATTSSSWFLALATTAPAALAIAIGSLTSQLAATRRKALSYGMIPLIIFFVLRSLGNVLDSARWLKYFTPFGWIDLLHPLTGSDWRWFLPLATAFIFCLSACLVLVRKRDLLESTIADNPDAKARFKLLSGPLGLSFRLTRFGLLGWLLATIGVSSLIASLSKTATSVASDSPEISQALAKLSGSNNFGVAFFSISGFMIALLLMIVIASGVSRIREDEAKGYLDNFLVGSVSRTRWIIERAVLLITSTAIICLVASTVCWFISYFQDLTISASSLIGGSLNYLGPALLMLGVGILLLGIIPRYTGWLLYAWIAFSFLIEMIGSVVNFNHYILDASLLRLVSLVPGVSVNWKLFFTTSAVGLICFVLGTLRFNQRDLQSE